MSVNDEDKFPWLAPEKEFIRMALARRIPVLGICLGAQLIAAATGAKVYQNPVKEIGWFAVRSVPVPAGSLELPKEFLAFHWHGEMFDIPQGAVRLAESDACSNQAFQMGRNAIGLQFHLETMLENALALLDNCRDDLVAGPFVQSEPELRAVRSPSYERNNGIMATLRSLCRSLPINLTGGGASRTWELGRRRSRVTN